MNNNSMDNNSLEKWFSEKHPLGGYVNLLKEAGLLVSVAGQALADGQTLAGGEPADDRILGRSVDHLSFDSSDVKEGTLFICKGAHFKEGYLWDAVGKGAFAYVSEAEYKLPEGLVVGPVPVIVTDVRKAMPLLADFFCNQAWKKLKLIGITGTKGKSTTAYYIKNIIDKYMASQGKPSCGIISSIDTDDGIIREESHITTPEALVLHRHFSNAVKSGKEYMVMEVSSQSLRYDRTVGITFSVAIFLNIGEDHISAIEHKDFNDYFSAKLMLLDQCEKACINGVGDHMNQVLAKAEKVLDRAKGDYLTFGISPEMDISAENIKTSDHGLTFTVKGPDFKGEINLAMTGLFNVENALAAIASCYLAGVPMAFIVEGLKTATAPGRMELFTGEKTGVKVIVDYAHNKMSFESLFESTKREYPGKKIFAVYGCPGGKAQARRWELSEVAGKHSAKAFITEEDHGEEDLMKISKEIAEYVEKTGCPYEIENDRELAIKKAIEEADENTIILITGKGRETRQKRGMDYVETLSDVDFVLKYLK